MRLGDLLTVHPVPWNPSVDQSTGDLFIKDAYDNEVAVPMGDCFPELAWLICRMVNLLEDYEDVDLPVSMYEEVSGD